MSDDRDEGERETGHDSDQEAAPDRLTYSLWSRALHEGELLGQRCGDCRAVSATPRAVCGECGGHDLETIALPRTGTVHTTTTIEVAPVGFMAPYRLAVVDLGEARVLARLDSEASIGERVSFDGAFDSALEDDEPVPVFS